MSCDKADNADATQPQPAPPNHEPEVPEVTVASSELLRGQREILIRHGDETYRLRLTRNGKLILHK